jgi:hypothetical protein
MALRAWLAVRGSAGGPLLTNCDRDSPAPSTRSSADSASKPA